MKVLLSIKPEFAEKILNGTKRFEFRRRVHKASNVEKVVIYSTKPSGKVVGEFTIQSIHSGSPEAIWALTKDAAGISKEFFDQYFAGRQKAFAIEVKEATRFSRARSLNDYMESGVAPQSYAYVA